MFGSRYVCALALLLLTACNGTDEMRWKEQVYLHDGTTVTVDRDSTRVSSGFPNSRRGNILTQELRYAPLGVVWKVEGGAEQLVSFDIVDGVAYVVANAPQSSEVFCNGKRHGEPIMIYYRWVNGKQESISSSDVPISIMRWNLSGIGDWGRDSRSDPTYLSWHDVADANAQSPYVPPLRLKVMFEEKSWLHCKSNSPKNNKELACRTLNVTRITRLWLRR